LQRELDEVMSHWAPRPFVEHRPSIIDDMWSVSVDGVERVPGSFVVIAEEFPIGRLALLEGVIPLILRETKSQQLAPFIVSNLGNGQWQVERKEPLEAFAQIIVSAVHVRSHS
jgi:hypothetical protein